MLGLKHVEEQYSLLQIPRYGFPISYQLSDDEWSQQREKVDDNSNHQTCHGNYSLFDCFMKSVKDVTLDLKA